MVVGFKRGHTNNEFQMSIYTRNTYFLLELEEYWLCFLLCVAVMGWSWE